MKAKDIINRYLEEGISREEIFNLLLDWFDSHDAIDDLNEYLTWSLTENNENKSPG